MTKEEILELFRKLDAEKPPKYEQEECLYKGMDCMAVDMEVTTIVQHLIPITPEDNQ